jgi:hypothetical protein
MLDAPMDLDNNTEGLDWGVIAEKVSCQLTNDVLFHQCF